jgi:hypothetical protein
MEKDKGTTLLYLLLKTYTNGGSDAVCRYVLTYLLTYASDPPSLYYKVLKPLYTIMHIKPPPANTIRYY